jgi:pyruvate formate lyase activating enzyme
MTEVTIAGIADSSTVDYPGRVCAVVYICGCPYRCPWCQNPELVLKKGGCAPVDIDVIIKSLKQNFLVAAVCVTGGEPVMQEGALEFLRRIKTETGFALKLDTNGCCPEELAKALPYTDFLSMDVKAPLDERYGKVIGLPEEWENAVSCIRKTLAMLRESRLETEARTTIVPGLIDTKEEIIEIAHLVGEARFRRYVLQQFRPMNTLDPAYRKVPSPKREQMLALGKIAKERLPNTSVRIVTQEKGFEDVLDA